MSAHYLSGKVSGSLRTSLPHPWSHPSWTLPQETDGELCLDEPLWEVFREQECYCTVQCRAVVLDTSSARDERQLLGKFDQSVATICFAKDGAAADSLYENALTASSTNLHDWLISYVMTTPVLAGSQVREQ